MKAVGYQTAHPIDHPESLLDITLPDPVATGPRSARGSACRLGEPRGHESAQSSSPSGDGPDKVLGWDASGIVRAVGPDVAVPARRPRLVRRLHRRQGTNSELHLVDERIVGHAPKSLDLAEAAAPPLTTITRVGAAV